ncbi:hypothetical protein ACFQ6Q_00510 [Streptomyces sp. NPDC056437]|uniref:hypothetical protein n=1 Tax=Streptomyces sp. NPDC056437 TaxID=3345816 RepID=UPI003696958F
MSAPDPEFDRIINHGYTVNQPEILDQNPYGIPVHPHKTGLTTRGKAALGIGAAVLATGSLIGYQAYSASVAEKDAKAKELQLQVEALELEKLREINRASEVGRKAEAGEAKARQASIDTCVKSHAELVGKGYGSPTHRDVVEDCQAQYGAGIPVNTSGDLQAAASTTTAAGSGDGGGSQGVLIGGGALALLFMAFAAKGKRTNPA